MAAGLSNTSMSVLRAATDAVLCCGLWPGASTTDGVQCRSIGSADMCQEAWNAAATSGALIRVKSTDPVAATVGNTDLAWVLVPPKWNEVLWPWVVLPIMYEVLFMVGCPLFARIYKKLFNNCECFERFVLKYIGCPESPDPLCPSVLIWLEIWQLMACVISVLAFTYRTLYLDEEAWVTNIEMFLGWGFVFHYFVLLMNTGFIRQQAYFTIAHVVELLTVPQYVCGMTVAWLTMGYLRSYRAMVSYEQLEELNTKGILSFFTWATPVQRLVFQSAIRFVSIIVCFAGTILILEVLGEPYSLQERYLETEMGKINIFVMAYWVLETISTVGYGDFAPKTTLSRFVTAACFLTGVIFFASETSTIADIWRMQTFGTGSYADRGRKHVLLCGGAAEAIDADSLKAFFAELFHPSFKQMSPDAVVLVTTDEAVVAFRDFVKNEVEVEYHCRIEILRGSALVAADLQRCRCGEAVLAVVLADTRGFFKSEEDEDQENILRALSIQQTYPETPLRLELLCQESRDLAVSARIWPQRCLVINRMRASLLWQSCRCVGWSSLIGNLCMTTDTLERTHILSANQKTCRAQTWRAGYVDGLAQEVYGFLPAMEYVGRPFLDLVQAAYSIENAIVIAAQVCGKVRLAPFHAMNEVTEDTVVFSLDATLNLDDAEDADNTVLRTGEWQKVFYTNRRKHRQGKKLEGQVDEDLTIKRTATADSDRWLSLRQPSQDLQVLERQAADIRNGSSSKPFVLFIEFAESWRTVSSFLEARAESWHSSGSNPELSAVASWGIAGKMSTQSGREKSGKPLIVLAPTEPPQDLWGHMLAESDAPIGLVLGSGKCMQVLAKAGVHEASCIVCPALQQLVGNAQGNSERATQLDVNAVMLYNILGRLQLLGKANVIMEMHRIENVRLLPRSSGLSEATRSESADSAAALLGSNGGGEEEEDQLQEERFENQLQLRLDRIAAMSYREMQQAMLVGGNKSVSQRDTVNLRSSQTRLLLEDSRSIRRRPRCWHGCLRRSGYLRFRRALHREAPFKTSFGVKVCGSDKYISGEVFSPGIFAALIARTNYVPGILEVIQALVVPEEVADVFPWQIAVRPTWIGEPFSKVFHDLLEDPHGPSLGLGLYRILSDSELASEPDAPKGFVWTNPAPDTVVQSNDCVYVLASSAWGKHNQ